MEPKIGGIYRNFKTQNLYKVLSVAVHSETLEKMVVYECQYENPIGKIWVRPLSMFMENVTKNGVTVPRFSYVEE